MGPGVYYDETSERIYIRMVAPRATATFKAFDLPSDPDPRKLPLILNPYSFGFVALQSTGMRSHVRVSDLKIHHHHFSVGGTFHDSRFENLELRPSMAGIRLGNSVGVKIDRVDIDAHLPPWVAWTDIKGGETPAYRIRAGGISDDGAQYVEVTNSSIRNVFDGMVTTDGFTHGFKILNNQFLGIWDDAIQLGARTYDIEFAYNLVQGAGPSHDGGALMHDETYEGKVGTKYFHHNVFDNSKKKLLWGRNDPTQLRVVMDGPRGLNQVGWLYPAVFTAHYGKGFLYGDPWKVYNNTFVIADRSDVPDTGLGLWGNLSTKNIPHELYNNIFQLADATVFIKNTLPMSGNEIYDGNVFYKGKNNPEKTCNYAFVRASDTRMSVPNEAAFNFSAIDDFTIAMWVRMDRVTDDAAGPRINLLTKKSASQTLSLNVVASGASTGKILATAQSGGAAAHIGLTRIDDGKWHHLAYVVDRSMSGTAALYLDGMLDSSKLSLAKVGALEDPSADLVVGMNLNAEIDELKLLRRAMSAQEFSSAVADPQSTALGATEWKLESYLGEKAPSPGVFLPVERPGIVGSAYAYSGNDFMTSYATMADFLASDLREKTKAFYAPGWESKGLEADPMLGVDYVPSALGAAAVPGVDLSDKGWPATSGGEAGFRGAFRPR